MTWAHPDLARRLAADATLYAVIARAVADPRAVVPGDTDEHGEPLLLPQRTAAAVLAVLVSPLRRICQERVDRLAGRIVLDNLAEGRLQALADVAELVDARYETEVKAGRHEAAQAWSALAGRIARMTVEARDAKAEAWRKLGTGDPS